MQRIYAFNDAERRKLRFLYHQSGIQQRYSVIPDYTREPMEWKFYADSENLEPFPSIETRMQLFSKHAPALTLEASRKCLDGNMRTSEITHLITVSCTGMSAPGLDLQLLELLDLPKSTFRTSVNFMGCYAALHAMKLANAIIGSERNAKVLIVCTELCTLHFQKEATADNITSSLLFGDGSAAALIVGDDDPKRGLSLKSFYSEVIPKGKKDMSWEISSTGFLMTLSGYVPDLISEDLKSMCERALNGTGETVASITNWCIHPGGKKILDSAALSLGIKTDELQHSYDVLKEYGNMSSATILFVLKRILEQVRASKAGDNPGNKTNSIFGAAFGPGLTMETFLAEYSA
jgi:alkylresorcinol/alkylpyrone synthase